MLYVKNVPTWERALRILVAIGLLAWGLWGGAGPWACALVGRRLARNEKR